MAFMMPVMKNDWDIYNSQRSRRPEQEKNGPGGPGTGGRVRKVSESRSEGPALAARGSAGALSPHRSAPAMRSLSYCRAPPSRASLRTSHDSPSKGSASPPAARDADKFHSRLVEKLKRALGRSESRREEGRSWVNACLCAGRAPSPPSGGRAAPPACPTCDPEPRRRRSRRHTICDMFEIVKLSWVDMDVLTRCRLWEPNHVWSYIDSKQ